jgi:thiol:disulfide interchange protein DsbD
MKKILLVLLAFCSMVQWATAQDQPVQFAFGYTRVNDSIVQLEAKLTIAKGVQVFSVKKRGEDDPFVSRFILDSAAAKRTVLTDTATERGSLMIDAEKNRLFADSVVFSIPVRINAADSALIKGSFAWLAKKGDEYPSGEENFRVMVPAANTNQPAVTNDITKDSLWNIFWFTLVAGLLAIITPCVFPLVPVTVSFFLKRSKTRVEGVRNALWYSASIIAIYTIPTIALVLLFGDDILYQISTSAISNLIFFAIFIVFAISFFGAFELQLPNSWANKADAQAGKGGLSGIFFMALTLVIVSFSCTGPIVGTLLGETSRQGITLAPIIGMLGFGVGLALPFSLFAFFPSMLQSLPKSGGWLNSVKVCFGFIELALALKFLSNVDLIYHWRLLDRDVFLVLWIVIFTLMGVYLLGKLKFSHDSDLPYVSVPRLFFAIASFSFAVYLVPGLWGAPLRHLSGLIPPEGTQDFNLNELKYKIGNGGHATSNNNTNSTAQPPKRLTDKLHVPYGLTAYFTLEEGMAAAKALNKPVMLDFTGHSCANCRKMEQEVWKDPEVLRRMKEDFVLISLYVDESQELPVNEQYKNKDGEMMLTEGAKNLDYEITKFGFNSQPLYMFLDLKGEPLSNIKYGYDPDVQKFIQHLDMVKAEFAKRKP